MERFSRLTKSDKKDVSTSFFVLDIETRKLGATKRDFVFCCLYGENYAKTFYSVDEIKRELNTRFFRDKFIFAHNAEFDFTSIFGNIIEYDNSAIFSGSQLITFTNKNCVFADSMNLLKSSVKSIGLALGMQKHENKYILKQLKKGIITNSAIEYCMQDCKIIYEALNNLFSVIGKVKLTIASSALYYFRLHYMNNDWFYNSELTNEFFNSYYGGRVEVFKLGKTQSNKYDINSMYPYIMKSIKFPNISNLKKWKGDVNYFLEFYLTNKNYEGMIKCTVFHKEHYFGFLPKHIDGKLCFPTGEFSGCWNFNEIRFALKHGIIEIKEVDEIIYSTSVESPFINYVDDNYNKRMQNKGTFWELVFKYLLNSLYGKFGEKSKGKTTYFSEFPFDKIRELNKDGKKYTIQVFNEKRDDCFIIEDAEKHKSNSIAVYASYITSASRIYLLEKLIENKDKTITYCDTDSICCEGEIENISFELGGLKKEKEIIIELFGCKNYTEIREGVIYRKIKGIPKNAIEYSDKKFKFVTMNKSKSSIRNSKVAGKFALRKKTLSYNYDKRIVDEFGNTKPIHL